MHALYMAKQEFEQQKIQFLQQVEKQDASAGIAYAEKFRTASDSKTR
jgi:hypothetical protein